MYKQSYAIVEMLQRHFVTFSESSISQKYRVAHIFCTLNYAKY